jgi:hypothetical protein
MKSQTRTQSKSLIPKQKNMPKKRCQLMLIYQARDPSHLTRASNFKKLKARFSTN